MFYEQDWILRQINNSDRIDNSVVDIIIDNYEIGRASCRERV